MKPRVVVVGSCAQDLCWKRDAFPRPVESNVGAFSSGTGGKGPNQAVAAGRLGAPTFLVGKPEAALERAGSIPYAALTANAIGARSDMRPGTAPLMPTAQKLPAFLNTRERHP